MVELTQSFMIPLVRLPKIDLLAKRRVRVRSEILQNLPINFSHKSKCIISLCAGSDFEYESKLERKATFLLC